MSQNAAAKVVQQNPKNTWKPSEPVKVEPKATKEETDKLLLGSITSKKETSAPITDTKVESKTNK